MPTLLKYAPAAVLALLLGSPALACYTVYNRANQVVYHAAQAPVNMSYQLHQTLPGFYPGGHMVFSITDNDCPRVNQTRINAGGVTYVAGTGESVMQSPRTRPYRIPRN
jgi:hypothetical protein